jgi:hypothetical protein
MAALAVVTLIVAAVIGMPRIFLIILGITATVIVIAAFAQNLAKPSQSPFGTDRLTGTGDREFKERKGATRF